MGVANVAVPQALGTGRPDCRATAAPKLFPGDHWRREPSKMKRRASPGGSGGRPAPGAVASLPLAMAMSLAREQRRPPLKNAHRRRMRAMVAHIQPAAADRARRPCTRPISSSSGGSTRVKRHVHVHLPDSIKDMSPEQLAALMGGLVGGMGQEQPMGAGGAVDDHENTTTPGGEATDASEAGAQQPHPAAGEYTLAQVAAHNTAEDCWVVLDGGVYDVAQFRTKHPGGAAMLDMVAGTDASEQFHALHKEAVLHEVAAPYRVGSVVVTAEAEAKAVTTSAPAPAPAPAPARVTASEPRYTMAQVAAHCTREDAWLVVDGGVYDVTGFMGVHPGGAGMLKMVAGHDASQHFAEMHPPGILEAVGARYRIGRLACDGDGDGGAVADTCT
jgi:cytochrome b involved in lipid metabolism